MKHILVTMVLIMFCLTTAQKAAAQNNFVEHRIQTGPEGDSALYYWNPFGFNGKGHWQLASDSSNLRMLQMGITPYYYMQYQVKIGYVIINEETKIVYFDGYWRLYIKKE